MPTVRQQQGNVTAGRLGPFRGSSDEDLVFQFNPSSIDSEETPQYAANMAALTDYGDPNYSGPPPSQWVRNPPEMLSLELLLHETGDRDVERSLQRIDGFLRKDARSGEPRDLVFSFGRRHLRVRIRSKRVHATLYTNDLRVQSALVRLQLEVQRRL